MKKLLLSLMLVLVFNSAFSSANKENVQSQSKKKKEILIKGTVGAPVFRSLINSPVHVFLLDNVLTICFLESLGNVYVRILNLETNETVFLDAYDNQLSIFLNIPIDNIGKYQISFSSEEYEGLGEFSI